MSTQGNYNVVPMGFRGLRVLLVDNDTSSLLNIAKEMELFSYRVTTTELATVALSILRERKDSFDLIMADINVHISDGFKFIQSVRLIEDLPIILMSAEVNQDMIKEAMTKGACFFLKKPISSKNLKNVWQHVLRQNKYRNIAMNYVAATSEQEADSNVGKIEERNKAIERGSKESESDSFQIENDENHKKITGIRTKRSMSTDNSERGDFKRRKTEIEFSDKGNANSSSNSERGNSNERGKEVRENRINILETQLHADDACLKLKGVIDANEKREARAERVLDVTNELNLTQPQIFSQLQKYGVGTKETHFNKHGHSGQSVDFYKEPDSSVEVDEIQVFQDSSHSPGTFLEEVGSQKKYHKGARFL